ncbi:MAG TPA: hypothetical protein VFZ26_14155, partial [Gemmatimonadales bacterium]
MRSPSRRARRRVLLSLPIVVALAALGCGPEAAGPSPEGGPTIAAAEPPGLAEALAAQSRYTGPLLEVPGVVGTAVGLSPDGRAVVQVLTEARGISGIAPQLGGVPVRIVVTGAIRALPATPAAPGAADAVLARDRFERPVPIGVSTGNEGTCLAGTIGARVKLGSKIYALSNNHIYALENLAPLGSRVLQPGRYDNPKCAFGPDPALGALSRYVPIVFSRTARNVVDAAIAASSAAVLDRGTPSDGYGIPAAGPATAVLGDAVQKYGRTSGLTIGWVDGINATVTVRYATGVTRFVEQILVNGRGTFSRAGDSGSLIVTRPGRRPVGLLFAGTESGYTFANPIGAVLKS